MSTEESKEPQDEQKPRKTLSEQDKRLQKQKKLWQSCFLLKDGEANPQRSWRNREQFGAPCPRVDFVEAPNRPVLKDLAKKWLVPYGLLLKWHHDQKWDDERERFWSRVEGEQRALDLRSLAETRHAELAKRMALYEKMRATLEDTLRKGYIEETSPTGGTIQRELNPKDIKDITASLKNIDDGIDKCIGVTNALAKMGNGGDDLEQSKPVRRVRHNFVVTVEEEVEAETPALPPANDLKEDMNLLNDIVEGIVVEKKDGQRGPSQQSGS